MGERRLTGREVDALLAMDIPARLGFLGPGGMPRVVPVWFVHNEGLFRFTSLSHRRHVEALRQHPWAGLCVDVEGADRSNQQVSAAGPVTVEPDVNGHWTRTVTAKYRPGDTALADRRACEPRVVVTLTPTLLVVAGTFHNEGEVP